MKESTQIGPSNPILFEIFLAGGAHTYAKANLRRHAVRSLRVISDISQTLYC